MNFPKFWARGKAGGFSVWRWSDMNVEEARAAAQAAADKLMVQFKAHTLPQDRYGYGNRPMREPVIREMRDADGKLENAVTRNSYGCHVLNSAGAMFIDIDFLYVKPKGLLASFFGGKDPEPDPAAAARAKAAAWAQSHRGWNWRIYRTRAGLRLLASHALFDPADPVCEQVFEAMGADPLYRKLCQTQECFRARLTPKPWRCGMGHPPARWPFENSSEEQAFMKWDAQYQAACRTKATCRLVDTGSGAVHEGMREMVRFHDEVTRAESTVLELA